jgi:peptidyl-prolyl cis-trans isomerase-like 3
VDGFSVLEKVEKEAVGKNNRPLNDIKIEDVTIHANPIAIQDLEDEEERAREGE